MTKEFNLSEKISWPKLMKSPSPEAGKPKPIGGILFLEDIKEFIRLLKERTNGWERHTKIILHRIIDKLAGEDLL